MLFRTEGAIKTTDAVRIGESGTEAEKLSERTTIMRAPCKKRLTLRARIGD
jgi:hypothetical protein